MIRKANRFPMTRESNMTPDDDETPSFRIADQKIANLLQRLEDRKVCPCCTAQALAFHAAELAEAVMGTAEAIEMFEDVIAALREHDAPAPEPLSSTQTH